MLIKIGFVSLFLHILASQLFLLRDFNKTEQFWSFPLKQLQSSISHVNMPSTCSKSITKSGYLLVNPSNNSALFIIFHGKRQTDEENLEKFPLIVWLNGGPGSSSQVGNFYELGPCKLNKTAAGIFEEIDREISWTDKSNLLIVDQPIGVGGSIAENVEAIPKNELQVAEHFYQALKEFYSLEFGKRFIDTPLFLTGESYAGKYVPNIAKKILMENNNPNARIQIPLKGIAIGDAWTDPIKIVSDISAFSYQTGILDPMTRINEEGNLIKMGILALNEEWLSSKEIFEHVINEIYENSGAMGRSFFYNMRQYADRDNKTELNDFFNNPETKARYHLQCQQQRRSSDMVYYSLSEEFMKPEFESVEQLLNTSKIKVYIFQGQDDLIVNNFGASRWVNELRWFGKDNFHVNFSPWKINDITVGQFKKFANLQYWSVLDAGHYVPADQPQAALDMLSNLINPN